MTGPRRLGLDQLCDKLEEIHASDYEEPPPRPAPVDPDPWTAALWHISELPDVYHRVTEAPLPPSLAEWLGEPWAVTILGVTGCGKTWLAVQLAALRSKRCRFADAADAIEAIRREVASDRDGKTLDQLCDPTRVLLLDDFGAERDSDFSRDKLGYVLRSRYNAMAPTIVTSNRTLRQIAEAYPREASRLGEGIVHRLGGRDRRLVQASDADALPTPPRPNVR